MSLKEEQKKEFVWVEGTTLNILMCKQDGYINVPKLCELGGKRFKHWLENKSSKELMSEFETQTGLMAKYQPFGIPNELRGTYLHPDLIPHVASWVSPSFAIFVSKIIREWKSASPGNEKIFWARMGNDLEREAEKEEDDEERKERKWQLEIASREGGECEVETRFGRIDVLTQTKLIEIKKASNWKHAIGQVLVYGIDYPEHEKWIYLFDWTSQDIPVINRGCAELGMNVCFHQKSIDNKTKII